MKIYTIKDIASLAGVSVTTVSRVLNHRPDVRPATRERVEKIMAECHFMGNANARGLKQQDSDMISVIVRGQSNPFLSALAEAILRESAHCKAAFLTEFIDESANEFETALTLFHQKRASAFLFVGSHVDERAEALDGVEVPMVFVTADTRDTVMARASSIAVDDRAMGREAVQALLMRGHTRIGMLGGNRHAGDGFARRYQGALEAFLDAGLTFDEERYVETRFSLQDAYDATRALLAKKPDTTALFCMSDTVAMGAIRALGDLKLRVPEDVSVLGFDGIEMGKYFMPRLSTVEQPVAEMAREAVATLTAMLEKGEAPRHVTVQAALRLRESV